MIHVKVLAIMKLAAAMGGREQIISLQEDSSVFDLLNVLEEKHGPPLGKILARDENGVPDTSLNLMLNGRNIIFLHGLETKLNDGDELFFLSPVGGG